MATKKPTPAMALNGGYNEGGPELLPFVIRCREDELIELDLSLFKSAFRVVVTLDTNPIVDETRNDAASVTLPPLSEGRHTLQWAFFATAAAWQVRSEVSVSDLVRFRQRKSNTSDKSYNHSFLYIEVSS
jgi:hypothetical protein